MKGKKLDYSERTRIIGEWVQRILSQYDMPGTFTKDRARTEMNNLVEDINSELPGGLKGEDFTRTFDKMSIYIRKKNPGRSWPTIKVFMSAVKDSITINKMISQSAAILKFEPDHIAAKRIKSGEPVGESYITGKGYQRLIDANLIKESDVDKYKNETS